MKNKIYLLLIVAILNIHCSDEDNSSTPSSPTPPQQEYIEFTFDGRYYRNDWDEDYDGISIYSVVSGTQIRLYDEYLSITKRQELTPFVYPEDIEFRLRLNNITSSIKVECDGSNTQGLNFEVGDFTSQNTFGVYDACSGNSSNNVDSYVQFNFTSIPTNIDGFYEATFSGVLEYSNLPGATPKNIQGKFRLKRTT